MVGQDPDAKHKYDSSDGPSYRAHVDDLSFERPHVFLLGAGASRAAFPDGDARRKHLPLMNDLVETLDLAPVLSQYGVTSGTGNFEELYARLAADERYQTLTEHIETCVRDYFTRLQLPAVPTLYDHLVLSLRAKDVIATFNWDPFLFDACARNSSVADPPRTLFLHGNVRVGYCAKHRPPGAVTLRCPEGKQPFASSRLIFPVTE